MDYKVGKLNKWDCFGLLIFILILVFNIDIKELEEGNLNMFLIQGGIFIFIIKMIYDFIKEENINDQVKDLLILEIDRNLTFINEDIAIILEYRKKAYEIKGFCYLDNSIFMSMLNSGKIIILSPKITNSLFNFSSAVRTINKSLDRYKSSIQIGKGELIFDCLKRAKYELKQILYGFKKAHIYEKTKLKGITRTLKEEHILIDDIKF